MTIDNASLLIAIAFSSASLTIALVIGWLNSRHESYLVHGAAGVGLIVLALGIMGLRNGAYTLLLLLVPFALLLAGFSLIYSASRLFRNKAAKPGPVIIVATTAILCTALPLLAGLSGLGTVMLNASGGVIMGLCALQFWRGRHENLHAMTATALLYAMTALSFIACAVVLALEGTWILTAPPNNWAEDVNSIMSLVGLTGIGALTLTLHHARAARRHRMEANTDSLTGVLNRRALFDQFDKADPVPGLVVLMFDLDHFKQVNDRRGHAEGDRVLQQFADVLKAQLRRSDPIARLGGEEFCALLPGLDRDAARMVAERIRSAFEDLAIPSGSGDAIATVSVGLASGGADETFASVLKRADAALYKAKRSGRNQVHLAALRLVA